MTVIYSRLACALALTLIWSVDVCAQTSKQEEALEQYLGKISDLPSCAHTNEKSPFLEGIYFPVDLMTQAQQKAGLADGKLLGLDPPPYIEIAPNRLSCPGRPEVRTMFENFWPDVLRPKFPAVQIPCYTPKGLRVRVAPRSTCDESQEDKEYVTLNFVQKLDPLRLVCDKCAANVLPTEWIYVGKRKTFPGEMSVLQAVREYLRYPNIEDVEHADPSK